MMVPVRKGQAMLVPKAQVAIDQRKKDARSGETGRASEENL
jgi:hypothetical protein